MQLLTLTVLTLCSYVHVCTHNSAGIGKVLKHPDNMRLGSPLGTSDFSDSIQSQGAASYKQEGIAGI